MPDNMKLHPRLECPSQEDTPPSTRPSSAASSAPSTASTPHRSTSMDSLHTNSPIGLLEKPVGEEYIPTRLNRATPKVNANALQFIKTGPANLHRSAKEQMKKADEVKSRRKTTQPEEEEWQANGSTTPKNIEADTDWQMNLDKWKGIRRKRNEDVLERVIEVKKYEMEGENGGRRKSKTFNEMREETNKRSRKYNLVVHDDDDNDFKELGLTFSKGSSLSDANEESEPKDNDIKDTKSDAGFCTGSDTGSDGVFAEDNISDSSSTPDDKKDAHDSLFDSGVPNGPKDSIRVPHIPLVPSTHEYTYDKAIEDYKQFAENSVRKRTPSVTSTTSSMKDEEPSWRSKMSNGIASQDGRDLKIDISKRKSMFELRDFEAEEKHWLHRRSLDVTSKLKTKVLSFERITDSESRPRRVNSPRDSKFQEKLDSFSKFGRPSAAITPTRKKTPDRDQNFYQKLQSFTQMESSAQSKLPDKKVPGVKKWSTLLEESFQQSNSTSTNSNVINIDPSLKDGSNSLEETPSPRTVEKSVSVDSLRKTPREGLNSANTLPSESSHPRKHPPATPYVVVEIENQSVGDAASEGRLTPVSQTFNPASAAKRRSVHEEMQKTEIIRDVQSAPLYSIFNHSGFEQANHLEERKEQPLQKREFGCSDLLDMKKNVSSSSSSPYDQPVHGRGVGLPTPSTPVESESRRAKIEREILEIERFVEEVNAIQPSRYKEYDDEDIDEVIDNYESITESASTKDKKSPSEAPASTSRKWSSYKNIPADEPTYENIKKVPEIDRKPPEEHNYCNLQEVKKEAQTAAELKVKIPSVAEVVDVTSWTGEGALRALPPSVPPPSPPPSDEDELEDGRPPSSPLLVEDSDRRLRMTTKQDLRQKRSDFLGSVPHADEEVTLQPPPNVNEMLKQERQAERRIVQKQQSLSRESALADIDTLLPQPYRSKYTWEDRMRDDCSRPCDLDESGDQFEFHTSKKSEMHAIDMYLNYVKTHSHCTSSTLSNCTSKHIKGGTLAIVSEVVTEGKNFLANEISPERSSKSFASTVMKSSIADTQGNEKDLVKKKNDDKKFLSRHHCGSVDILPNLDISKITGYRTIYTNDKVPKLGVSRTITIIFPSPKEDDVNHAYVVASTPDIRQSTALVEHHSNPPKKSSQSVKLQPASISVNPHKNPTLEIGLPKTALLLMNESVANSFKHLKISHAFSKQKLAELEQEMVKHDREMLQRIKGTDTSQEIPRDAKLPTSLSDQNSPLGPYCEYAGNNHSQDVTHKFKDSFSEEDSVNFSSVASESTLPVQEFYTTPSYVQGSNQLNKTNHLYEEHKPMQGLHPDLKNGSDSSHNMGQRKQNIKALSALPKQSLTDNESWIKRKADAMKKDYNKHWLFQEAEQRRIEQQDRITRSNPPFVDKVPNSGTLHSSFPNTFQNKNNNCDPSVNYDHNLSKPPSLIYQSSNMSNLSPNPYTSSSSSSDISESNRINATQHFPPTYSVPHTDPAGGSPWKQLPKTYQPAPLPPPAMDKPLPDAIIDTLTKRVGGKNKTGVSASRPQQYSNNYLEENYHDYMNTDFNQSGSANGSPSPQCQQPSATEEQRLLSVSGKKKCSHCGDELGRGAAMIIESLRLFYHIPCFKCCVCGVQLGNGTSGADVRVRNHKLHCHNCYSNDEGMKFSKV